MALNEQIRLDAGSCEWFDAIGGVLFSTVMLNCIADPCLQAIRFADSLRIKWRYFRYKAKKKYKKYREERQKTKAKKSSFLPTNSKSSSTDSNQKNYASMNSTSFQNNSEQTLSLPGPSPASMSEHKSYSSTAPPSAPFLTKQPDSPPVKFSSGIHDSPPLNLHSNASVKRILDASDDQDELSNEKLIQVLFGK